MKLQKIALVTGVGREGGLGLALCRKLHSEGCRVIVTARNTETAERMAALVGENAVGHVLDVTSDQSVSDVLQFVSETFGRLDILINNAAATSPWGEKAASPDFENASAIFDVILFGTWRMCAAFLPLLRASGSGRLVNVSSGAGSHGDTAFGLHTGNQMGTTYGAAKAALNALTVKLALEEEPSALRINAVCPGFTATFDGGAEMGARPVSEGADSILWATQIANDGPTGGFFRDGNPLPW